MRSKLQTIAALAVLSTAATAGAAVSADEAKQLGGAVLTEWGAERAGNRDGSIPAWTGERVPIPAGFNSKEAGQAPDPWGDKPLYAITAQNMDKYADKLSDGQKEMFRIYPNYRMDVYQTRRTVLYPKWLLENTVKNATSAKAANGGVRLEGAYAGIPFPIPKTGNEVIWNHNLAWSPPAFGGLTQVWLVDRSGKNVLQGLENVRYQFPYWDPSIPGVRTPDSQYWVVRFESLAPARKVGERFIIINHLDPINPGTRAWAYIPGQRRVKLAPDLAYDTPSPVSAGVVTMDEGQVFQGGQDRYDFKLAGKAERYILVNQQKTSDYKTCPPEKIMTPGFPNPECIRFELHRVWQVDATLKPGYRHIFHKRKMYFDEDWSGAAVGDMYDAAGKLYRVDYSPITLIYDPAFPDVQYQQAHVSWTFDLQTGNYVNQSYMGFKEGRETGGYVMSKPLPSTFFTPDALAAGGIR